MNEANIENQAALALARELMESKVRATHAANMALNAAVELADMLVKTAMDVRQACALAAPLNEHDELVLAGIEARASIILRRFGNQVTLQ